MPGKVFINYRRDDVPGDARGIRDALARKYGAANVFMDIDNLRAGQRFDEELKSALAQCSVLIAVIGPRWLPILRERAGIGERDFVREEIAAALERRISIVPVRVGREGQMPVLPRDSDLPEDIRGLLYHQKHDVAHEFAGRDIGTLVQSLAPLMGSAKSVATKWSVAVAGLALSGLLVAGLAWNLSWRWSTPDAERSQLPPSASPAIAPADLAAAVPPRVRDVQPAPPAPAAPASEPPRKISADTSPAPATPLARKTIPPALVKLLQPQALPDIVLGSPSAPITVVEYASMTCVHCATFHTTVLAALKQRYIDTGKVRWIYRDFPLDAKASAAAMMVRCSGGNKQLDFIQALYGRQQEWSAATNPIAPLKAIAAGVGMSDQAFEKCLSDQKLLEQVTALRERATTDYGVNSTPTFFVDGDRLASGAQLKDFEAAFAQHRSR